ncbi:protein EMBRYONIC FLOWER 1-like isoform X1 [Cucurbita maxima]|uniref:Protein EMBRYONIC FLOWER 1-like isoform X1 n=1 Tax=Cucurbita maxima TaxID=3661 RepID=A0A6J1IFE3_CUCMA|nr:protein EMBRYONIC FLOWER 1-like isoform X1 [Cucurbita maxima]XP_022976312.1 protein EMBRYONIC FLOWER 1-like isoform X1 [Cucurbita maxima]
MDEEHHQKNDSSIILRTSVPFIEIDSLFIDLSSCIDKPDAGNSDYFSIRGYASQMREKDWKKCWPFDLDGDYEPTETMSFLPPFCVPQFRWQRCQNCRKETPAGFEQSLNLAMPDAKDLVANASTNVCNLNHPPSFITEKEKKAEGYEVDSRWILNPEIPIPISIVPEVESSLMLEQNRSDPVTLNPDHRESVENCNLLCGNEIAEVELGIRNLKVIDENPEVFDDEKKLCAHNEQTEIALSSSGEKAINRSCNSERDPANGYPAELDESDATSSEHTEISVENDTKDHRMHKSGSLHRRKARKVRLLTELLNENENIKTNPISTGESSSHGISENSEGLKELSVSHCPVAAKKNIRWSGQNLKSVPLNEDCLAAETSSSYNVDNKIQALKGDVETTDSFRANESENALIGTALRTKKSFLNKCWNDVKSIHGKKKNKKIQLEACPLNIPSGSGGNMSDISLKHNEFSGSAMDPFLLFGSRIEPISSLSKRNSKMPIIDDRRGFTWSNSMPRRDSASKEGELRNKEGELRNNVPTVVSCPSVPDEPSGGLHLSLTSNLATARNDKKSIFKTEDGLHSLLSWQGSTSTASVARNKDAKAKKLKDSNVAFNYSDNFSGRGHCGVNGKITTGRMHTPNGKQKSKSQVNDGSWSHLQAMDNSRVDRVEKSITIQQHLAAQMKQSENTVGKISEQRSLDDIPMEIVELMAKNQYERCLDNSGNSKSLSKTSSKKAQIMNFSNACGKSGSLQEKISHNWKSQVRNLRNNLQTAGDSVVYGKQSSGNYFSHTEAEHLNIDHLRQTLILPEYPTFRHSESKSSNAVKILARSNCENACSQYSQYTGGLRDQDSSHSRVQYFRGNNTRHPVSQNNVDVAHLWTEALPNHHSYVPTTPRKVASQLTSVNASKNCPESSRKGAMNRDHNPKVTNLEKDDGIYGLENFSRTSAKYPFPSHSNGIELPRNQRGPLDLYSNETMSAMHLLSLMDAGMQRSETHDNPKFPNKPFSHEPKAKDISGMDNGLHKSFDTINYLSDYYGEIHPQKKSHDCFHRASMGGVSVSPSIGNESCEIVADLTGKVALQRKQKEITKCSTSTWNRAPKSQKGVLTSGSLGSNEGVFPIHSLQKKSGGPSSSLVSMSGYHRVENPGQCIIERHGTKRMLEHSKVGSEFGICSINKNPAEFSIPEAGNVYMIGAEDLQFSKRISKKTPDLNNMDGRKRKRNMKHAVVRSSS